MKKKKAVIAFILAGSLLLTCLASCNLDKKGDETTEKVTDAIPSTETAPDGTTASDVTTSVDITTSEVTTSPEVTNAPEATTVPEVTNAPEVTTVQDITTVSEATTAPEVTTTPEATTSEIPVVTEPTHTHSFSVDWKSDASNHWKECSCGEKAELAGHTYGDWTVTKAATETATGERYHTCTVCGYKETNTVPTLDHIHSFGAEWKSDGTNHWHECSCGERSDYVAHSFGEWSLIKEETCSVEGERKHSCIVCGCESTEKIEKKAHVVVVDAAMAPTCSETGVTEGSHCSVCGEIIIAQQAVNSLGHDFIKTNVSPTRETSGYTENKCSRCGLSYMDSFVDPIQWDGFSISDSFFSGTGTKTDPYIIASEADLARLAQTCNDGNTYSNKYFRLETDLNLGNKTWLIIGSATAFSGVFDGDNHTISGLSLETDWDYAGLFGWVCDATIKNLRVKAGSIIGNRYVGIVVGCITVSANSSSSIINCHAIGAEKLTGNLIGGIAGDARGYQEPSQYFPVETNKPRTSISIIGCSTKNVMFESFVYSDYGQHNNAMFGGIVGAADATLISGCWAEDNSFDVGGELASSIAIAGGIVGLQGRSDRICDVINCYAINNAYVIRASTTANPDYAGCGGLIGRAAHQDNGCRLINCFSYGNLFDNQKVAEHAGGVCGGIKNVLCISNIYYNAERPYGFDACALNYPMISYPVSTITSSNAVSTLSLNNGNSNVVWKYSESSGHPIIDIDAVLKNENSSVTWEPFTNS